MDALTEHLMYMNLCTMLSSKIHGAQVRANPRDASGAQLPAPSSRRAFASRPTGHDLCKPDARRPDSAARPGRYPLFVVIPKDDVSKNCVFRHFYQIFPDFAL
eukprot:6583664-Pyramimonas_sp.AAC.1